MPIIADTAIEQRRTVRRLKTDFREFFEAIKIYDKDAKKLVNPKLRHEQYTLYEYLSQYTRVIVGKPRQIGATTLNLAYIAWQAYFSREPNQYLICSLKDISVKKLVRTISKMYATLPVFMRRKYSVCNDHQITFEDTGATIFGYAAGGRGGARSDVATFVLMTEFAFYPNQEEFLISIDAIVGSEGTIIIETTADGPGDVYHELVMDASAGRGEYKLCFFPWTHHDRYRLKPPKGFELTPEEIKLGLDAEQAAWRRRKIVALKNRVEQFRREYPLTPEDAFIDSSSSFFASRTIGEIKQLMSPENRELKIYQEPVEGRKYGIAADVALGVGGDDSVCMVIDFRGNVCAAWHDNYTRVKDFAVILKDLSEKYSGAIVLVESNSYGAIVLDNLKEWGVPLWRGDDKDNWTTGKESKLYAYQVLENYWMSGLMLELPRIAVLQLNSLIVNNHTPEAPVGNHDDYAMTTALAAVLLKSLRRGVGVKNLSSEDKPDRLPIEEILEKLGVKRGVEWQR